jgi:hypothetical protein
MKNFLMNFFKRRFNMVSAAADDSVTYYISAYKVGWPTGRYYGTRPPHGCRILQESYQPPFQHSEQRCTAMSRAESFGLLGMAALMSIFKALQTQNFHESVSTLNVVAMKCVGLRRSKYP